MIRQLINRHRLRKLKQGSDSKYAQYLTAQYHRSILKAGRKNIVEANRKNFLVSVLRSRVNLKKVESALVIGCRDSRELDLLESCGVRKTVGIDLFSNDKRVRVMDMHDVQFEDNCFELIYGSHVLEHALNFEKVLENIARIIKPNGYLVIEVPTHFQPTIVDIHDFRDSDYLLGCISKYMIVSDVLYREDLTKGEDNNFCGTDLARLIIQVAGKR